MDIHGIWNLMIFQSSTIRSLVFLAVAAFMIGGCATEEEFNPGAAAETLVLTESLRIGDEATIDTVYIDRIWDMAVDAQGRILVVDNTSPGFRVFSPDGTLTHEVGSEGQAPGEFQDIPLLTIGAKDSVYAFDGDNRRLTVYSPGDYQMIRMVNLAANLPDNVNATDVLSIIPEGLVVQFEHFPTEDTADENDWPMEIKFLDHSGEIVQDSLVMIPSMQLTLISIEDLGNLPFPRLWGRESFIISGSDGLVHAGWNETIQVSTTSRDGIVGEFFIPHSPIPIALTEKNERVSRYPIEWQVQLQRDVPDTKPAFNAMVLDDMDRLWMQLSWLSDSTMAEWLVVETSTGDIVAKASLPVTAELMEIRQGKAYGIVDDEQTVVTVWEIGSSSLQEG